MNTLATTLSGPSENWDDDFEFSPGGSSSTNRSHTLQHRQNTNDSQNTATDEAIPRISAFSSNSTEDWGLDSNPRRSATLSHPLQDVLPPPKTHSLTQEDQAQLQEWAEPGPSTPRKPHQQQHPYPTEDAEENWDDDFEDKGYSPAKRSIRRPTSRSNSNTPRLQRSNSTPKGQETENWDDEFAADAEGKGDSPKRSRSDAYLNSSDEEDVGMGLKYTKDDEDHTVTARSRARRAKPKLGSPPPPVPALPTFIPSTSASDLALTAPFPRSPTASVFSVPYSTSTHNTAGRNSVATYTSTTHILAAVGKLTSLPPSPPIHRERRRLRKKSRPPAMYDNVYELVAPSHTPSRSPSPPPQPLPSPPRTPEPMDDAPVISSPKSASGMLSRIGSVKKWSVNVGQRRKRGSTTPSEINRDREDRENEGRPQSSASASSIPPPISTNPAHLSPSSKNWFFRGTGDSIPSSQEVKPREKSLDRLRSYGDLQTNGTEPAKLTKKRRSRVFEAFGRGADGTEISSSPATSAQLQEEFQPEDRSGLRAKPSRLSAIRRPSSMVTRISSTTTAVGHRHASDGTGSIGRSASNTLVSPSVEDLPPSRLGDSGKEGGGRRFGVRKLSFVKRHIRSHSGGKRVQDGNETDVFSKPSPVDELLPPIELQPPSPPQTTRTISSENTGDKRVSLGPKPLVMSLSSPEPDHLNTPPTNGRNQDYQIRTPPNAINPRSPLKTPGSPQSASLGRSTGPVSQVVTAGVKDVPRRNSLGDLKIPARISQAQVSLRRDLGMVREFAGSVEHLKDLQTTYYTLVSQVQVAIDTLQSAASSDQARERTTPSPTPFFHLHRPTSRARSNTNPTPLPSSSNQERHRQLATALYTINCKYRISWECAELLIELGGGSTADSPSNADSSIQRSRSSNAHVQRNASCSSHKSRERAITLAGDEGKPPVLNPPTVDANLAWRTSTRRHDLSYRQLVILREMLNNPDGTLRIPEDAVVNRSWHWGDAMSSTITLPSESSTSIQGSGHRPSVSPKKKRRGSKMGMSGLRDMLKALKKSNAPSPPLPVATPSVDSFIHTREHHYFPHSQIPTQQRGRANPSKGPELVGSERSQNLPPTSSYAEPALTHKSSPHRPSLASIFRIGQKSKVSLATPDSSLDSASASSSKQSDKYSTEEEDWDRMDSASDLEHAATALEDGFSTVKGRNSRSPYLEAAATPMPSGRPVTPNTDPTASRSSILAGPKPSPPNRTSRLPNVEENADDDRGSKVLRKGRKRPSLRAQSPSRPRSRRGLTTDSMRSAPQQSVVDPHSISEFKLAMTPENIKPLLENAREVQARLNACIAELQLLLAEES